MHTLVQNSSTAFAQVVLPPGLVPHIIPGRDCFGRVLPLLLVAGGQGPLKHERQMQPEHEGETCCQHRCCHITRWGAGLRCVLPRAMLAKSLQPFQPSSKAAPPCACNIWAGVTSRVQGPFFECFLELTLCAVFTVCKIEKLGTAKHSRSGISYMWLINASAMELSALHDL